MIAGLPSARAAAPALAHAAGYQFLAPIPGTRFHPPGTAITLRHGEPVDPGSLAGIRLEVTGSSSGAHAGVLKLARDGRTLSFVPARPFEAGETVRVALLAGPRETRGEAWPALDYTFTIRGRDVPIDTRALFDTEIAAAAARSSEAAAIVPAPSIAASIEDSLPAGYMPILLKYSNLPPAGGIFLSPFTTDRIAVPGRLQIVDARAMPLYFRSWPKWTFDFKRQPDGRLTFYGATPSAYYVMDSTYAVVDSFKMANGYRTDEHELQLLPNGHALLMAYDPQPYPMDTVVAGGNPNAVVVGLILEELDQDKNLVFEWRSWDHFLVTDFVECTGHLTDALIDAVHANAIERDFDGNLLLSSRHMNEITKIDRQTGDVIWRMGLNAKRNQFTFLDDPRGFSHQHDIRRLPNGHVTLFDNGNCLVPAYSRALEYELDETQKTARLVWEYRNVPDVGSPFMGSVQRHEDGSTTIGWGGSGQTPSVTELHPDGTRALELSLGSPIRWSYRALRVPWQTTAFETEENFDVGSAPVGGAVVRRLRMTNHLPRPLTLNQFLVTDPQFAVLNNGAIDLAPGESKLVKIRFSPLAPGLVNADLYVRSVDDTSLLVRVTHLAGLGQGIGVRIDDVASPEGSDGGLTPFVFTVRLSPPADTPVTVDYATADSSALASDGDYVPVSGTLSFAAGDSLATVTVGVRADTRAESNEVFHVVLGAATHALVVKPIGRGTILQDETVGVDPREAPAFALESARPNPAHDQADVGFVLPRAGRVALEVFDVRGRRIASLVNGARPAGPQSVLWKTRAIPAGLYFLRLESGNRTAVRRIAVTH